MPLNNPKSGIAHAGEFQSSALPWVTSSLATSTPTQYNFDHVSRFLTVTNTGTDDLRLGFTKNGVNGTNYVLVKSGSNSQTFEVRVKEVWVRANTTSTNYSLFVGLTNVLSYQMPVLSGSLPDGTPGWNGVG